MKIYLELAISMVVLLMVSSCKKETGTATTELNYSFSVSGKNTLIGVTADATGAVATDGTNGTINWYYISADISKIEFSSSLKGEKIMFESNKPFGTKEFKLDSLIGKEKISAGVYENIRLKISFATTNSLTLSGAYKEMSGTIIPLSVQFVIPPITLEIARYELNAGTYAAKVNLELNNLIKGLVRNDFGQTDRTTPNNSIVVSATKNKVLYDKLMINLPGIFKGNIVKN